MSAPAPVTNVDTRPYLLERVDDAAIVQLYADGFAALPLDQKTLIYHLYEAALAGRDIYYDQRYRHNLEMRAVLEQIITHAGGIDDATLHEVQRYTKLFWINTGPYNNLTARKFVLRCTPAAFAAAAAAAEQAGARFPVRDGESLEQMLARMEPLFFDPAWDAPMRPLPGVAVDAATIAADRAARWDAASVHLFEGTYGDYLLAKVGKVFPGLKAEALG